MARESRQPYDPTYFRIPVSYSVTTKTMTVIVIKVINMITVIIMMTICVCLPRQTLTFLYRPSSVN